MAFGKANVVNRYTTHLCPQEPLLRSKSRARSNCVKIFRFIKREYTDISFIFQVIKKINRRESQSWQLQSIVLPTVSIDDYFSIEFTRKTGTQEKITIIIIIYE